MTPKILAEPIKINVAKCIPFSNILNGHGQQFKFESIDLTCDIISQNRAPPILSNLTLTNI
ncbi:hypothetical protein CSE45_3972 [Citreicella sp. SE45]|nr:hypothetical protein CSE45_3972 [Citreicella sp. SE45]